MTEEAKPVEAPKLVEPPKSAEAAAPAVVAEAPKPAMEAPAAETKAPPVPVQEPVTEEEPSFIDENPMLVYGGGGLVVLLLAYLGLSRRRKSPGDENASTVSRLSEGDLMANSVFGTTGGQAVDTSASIQTDFSQASLSAIDTDEGVDPVAEADVYMAYGRDAQAEEILLDALKSDPARHAIYLKLLEIYSGHKNLAKFEKIAGDLKTQTGGAGPDWDKAAAMGRVLDAGNPLYASAESAAVEQVVEPLVPEISAPEAESAVEVVEQVEKKLESTVTLPGQLAQLAKAATPEAAQFPPSLGFDLDLGSEAAPATGNATAAAVGFEPVTGGFPDVSTKPDMAALDVDLSLPELGTSVRSPEPAVDSSGVDFEFDLDAPAPASAKTDAPLDFSGINLDLVTSSEPVVPDALESGLEDGDNPDVATKLELAQAYEEMGDREGARELLEEVVQEGSVRQQELARNKLAALDA
jgi:pilus assembly protein FimV